MSSRPRHLLATTTLGRLLLVITVTLGALPLSVSGAAHAAPIDIALLSVAGGEVDGGQQLTFARPERDATAALTIPIKLIEIVDAAVNAASPADVSTAQSAIVFASGASTATFNVDVVDDGLFEGPEFYDVELSTGDGPVGFRVEVTDSAAPKLTVVPGLGVLTEGQSTTVKLRSDIAPVNPIAFTIRAVSGSAVVGTDIAPIDDLAVLAPATTETSSVPLVAIDDDDAESYEESFAVAAFAGDPKDVPVDAEALASRAMRVIDNDPYLRLQRVPGQESSPTLQLEVTEPSDAPMEIVLPIDYLFDDDPYSDRSWEIFLETLDPGTDGGVATRGVDFDVTTAPFDSGSGGASLTLTIFPDDVAEAGGERARLGLRHLVFCDCNYSSNVDDILELVIVDGPTGPDPFVFDTGSTSSDILTEDAGAAQFVVRRESPSDAPATLRVVTVEGTAAASTDFVPVDTTVVLDATPLQSATIDIDIIDDALVDGRQLEEFTVRVFHIDSGLADAATTPVAEHTFTIEDDEAMFAFQTPAITIQRPLAGSKLVEVPIRALFTDWPLEPTESMTLRASLSDVGSAAGSASFVVDEITVVDDGLPGSFLLEVPANAVLPTRTLTIELARTPRFDGAEPAWIESTASLTITPPAPPSSIGDDVRGAIASVFDGFESWTPQFDLTVDHGAAAAPSAFELPVITGDLGELLDLAPAAELLAPLAFDTAADEIEALLLDLEGNGCAIDFVAGGLGGRPAANAGDIIQTTCSIAASTVAPTGESPLNDDVSDLYQWLIDQPRTFGNLAVEGSLGASITVGVDGNGPYITGATGLNVDVAAEGSLLTSTGTDVVASASGSAVVDFEVGLRLDSEAERRVRIADLDTAINRGLEPSVTGTAEVNAQTNNGLLALRGKYDAVVSTGPTGTIDVTASTTFTGVISFDLPRVSTVDDPTPPPSSVEITVVGTLSDAGLELVGTYDADTDLLLDGFDIVDARIETTLTGGDSAAPLRGSFLLEINDGFAPTTVAVDVDLIPGRIRGTAMITADTADFGVFQLAEPAYTITLDTAPDVGGPSVEFEVTASRLVANLGEVTLIDAADVSGAITSSSDFEFSLGSGTLGAQNGLFRFDVAGLTLQSPDAAGIIMRADSIEVPVPLFGTSATATVRDLVVDAGLRIGASEVEIDSGALGATRTTVGGLMPITLSRLGLEFTSRDADGFITDLDQFIVSVDAFVDHNAYVRWPFDPVIQLGGREIRPDSPLAEREISFSAQVDSIDPLVLRPFDLGPISLGIENFGAGRPEADGVPADNGLGFVFDGIITVDGYRDGVLLPGVEGLFTVSREGTPIPEQQLSVIGEVLTDDVGAVGLDLQVGFGFDLDLRPVVEPDEPGGEPTRRPGAELDGFEFVFNLEFGSAVSEGSPLPDFNFFFNGVRATSLSVPFGDLFEISATDIDLALDGETLFSGDSSALLLTVGGDLTDSATGASIIAGDALGPLAGWGGHAGNFGLTVGGQLVAIDDFFVGMTVPEPDDEDDSGMFGLPPWLPLYIDDLAVEFGDLRLDQLPALDELSPDVLNGIKIRVSGGLRGTELFPISANVDDLVVDIGKLATFDPASGFNGDDFPIENLSGVKFGITPGIDFGGFAVGGNLTFGEAEVVTPATGGPSVTTKVLYGRIAGYGESPIISGGVDLVISQYGPVLLEVNAPLGIPLGPTGFVLTDATGAATFGDVQIAVPDRGQPEQLLGALDGSLPTDVDITPASIAAAIAPSVRRGQPTWDDGFAIALSGHLSNVAAGGLAAGDVTLAVTVGAPSDGQIVPGVQAIGFGSLEVFGIDISESVTLSGEVGRAGIMFDLTNAASPRIDLAFETPAPGSPIGLIFPARATVAAQLDLTGVPAGVRAGVLTFVNAGRTSVGELVEQFVIDNPSSAFALTFGTVTGSTPAARLQSLLATNPDLVVQTLLGIIGANVGTVRNSLGVIRDGARSALIAAGDDFDPNFVFSGVLQPALLGIPLGEPETEVQITIDKNNIGFVATGSLIEALKDQVGLYTLSGDLAGGLFALATLNATDRMTFGVQIPVPDLRTVLLDGGSIETVDAADSSTQFAVTVEGDLSAAGMTMSVGGLFTAPNNANFVDTLVQKRFDLPADAPVDPDKVQITREVDYDNLIARGGLLLYGRLQVPRLITDPVGVIGDLPELPDDIVGAFDWFDRFGTEVTATEEPISATMFVPGLPRLGPSPVANEAAIDDWMDAVSLTGVLDGTARRPGESRVARLLSMPIGSGRMVATTSGLEITATVPMLGAEATFTARVDERSGTGSGDPVTVRVPVVSLDATTTSQAAIDAALDAIGLPSLWQPDSKAGFRLRAYSPGFDPSSADALQRSGGIAATATLDLPGLIDDASGQIEIVPAPPGTVSGPDWRASLDVASITVPGLQFTNVDLQLSKSSGVFVGAISGRVDIAIAGFATPSVPFEAAFAADGDFTFDFERTVTVLGSQLAVDLRGSVNDGVLAISGTATGQLSVGALDLTSGTFNVRLDNGVLEFSIPSTNPLAVPVFNAAQARVTGVVRSNQTYALDGSFTTIGAQAGVSWNGQANVSLRTNGAISGTFNGSVTAFGLNGVTTGSITRLASGQGQVTGELRVDLDNDQDFDGAFFPVVPERVGFSFVFGASLPPDINRPVFGPVPDISVVVSSTTAEVPVEFAAPTATDDRDGTITSACDPESGAVVTLAGTTVTCTARDAAGNAATVSFEITLRVEAITVATPQIEGPIEVVIEVPPDDDVPPSSRRVRGRGANGTIFSVPQSLGTATVNADGSIRFGAVLPSVESGRHHIVIDATTVDGNVSMVIVPLVVDANGALVEILGRTVDPPRPDPSGQLPRTGMSSWVLIRNAFVLLLVGAALLAATRRRRLTSNRPSPPHRAA